MGRRLEYEVEQRGDRTVLTVHGEIDLESSPRLLAGIQGELPRAGRGGLWIGLADVDYIDSSGIAVLVQGHKHAARARKAFGLLAPSKPVLDLIELAQLHRLFSIEKDRDTG